MSYTPSTAAQNTAAQAGTNQASLASPLTALQTSISNGNLAPAALFDAVLNSVGYQDQNDAAAGAVGPITSTSFGNIYSSWTTTASLLAKPYLLHVDLSFFATVAGNVFFQTLIDTVAQPTLRAQQIFVNLTSTTRVRLSWRQPITFSAGTHTIQLQWKTDGTASVNTDGNDFRCFTITG